MASHEENFAFDSWVFFFDNTTGVIFGFLILFPMNWSFDMLVVLIHAIVILILVNYVYLTLIDKLAFID